MSLILALEFDPDRAQTLKRRLGEWMDAEVVVAQSTQRAIEFMQRHRPDLILVSALTPPSDDWNLFEFVRQTPGTRQVPVLTVPPFIEPDDNEPRRTRGLLSLFGQEHKPRVGQSYDRLALRTSLREALEDSCAAAHAWGREANRDVTPDVPVVYDLHDLDKLLQDFARDERPAHEAVLEHAGLGSMRNRARRWSSKDLAWLREVQLPWGLRVELLNISSSGVLVESAACFVEGSTTHFRLCGPDNHLLIPARVIRTEVASGASRGVTYRAAAIFDRTMLEAELLGPTAAIETFELLERIA